MDVFRNSGLSASSIKPVRPWADFFQTASLRLPSNLAEAQSRFQHNLRYFQTNYLLILALFLAFCLYPRPSRPLARLLTVHGVVCRLTNVFFLAGFAASGLAFYFAFQLPPDFVQVVYGVEIKAKHLQIVWAIRTARLSVCALTRRLVSLILLYLTSAGTAIFWSIGATAVLVSLHAVAHDVAIESDFALPP